MERFEVLFLSFFVFSFLGWIWESVIFSLIDKHRLVNRGFMIGPYIPIYGTGALIDLLILGDVTNMVALFFLSAVLCTMVEYVTSFAMEKLFHARWWDYYDMLWHLNGRICMEGALAFGGLSVVLVQWVNPATKRLIAEMSPLALHITAWVLFAMFVTDFIVSVKQAAGFERNMRKVADMLIAAKDRMAEVYDTVVVETFYKNALEMFSRQQKRMLSAFPALRSINYPGILKSIRSVMPGSREKADLVSITERIMRRLKGESAENVNREVPTMEDEKKSASDNMITLQAPKDEDVSELSRMTDDYVAFLEKLDSGEITNDEQLKESGDDQ